MRRVSEGTPGVVLYITAGEETGSEGACGATPASPEPGLLLRKTKRPPGMTRAAQAERKRVNGVSPRVFDRHWQGPRSFNMTVSPIPWMGGRLEPLLETLPQGYVFDGEIVLSITAKRDGAILRCDVFALGLTCSPGGLAKTLFTVRWTAKRNVTGELSRGWR
jgi:hypothetical protein